MMRSRMGALDLVIWRGASGAVHVWRDHCPHRSVRLSAGRNMGSYLEDIYHGWRFGEDGTVIHIPAEGGKAHPDISAQVLNSTVSDGFVWAAQDTPEPHAMTGTPHRPLHMLVPAETARPYLAEGQHVTPWGDAACMVYGAGGDPVAAHAKLSALRRRLEGAA